MKELFSKKSPWKNKVTKTAQFLHLKKENPREKLLHGFITGLLYVAIFLAGYLTAKLTILL